MKIDKIRLNVGETNSSSVHTLVITKDTANRSLEEKVNCLKNELEKINFNLDLDTLEKISYDESFGWTVKEYENSLDILVYLAVWIAKNNDNVKEIQALVETSINEIFEMFNIKNKFIYNLPSDLNIEYLKDDWESIAPIAEEIDGVDWETAEFIYNEITSDSENDRLNALCGILVTSNDNINPSEDPIYSIIFKNEIEKMNDESSYFYINTILYNCSIDELNETIDVAIRNVLKKNDKLFKKIILKIGAENFKQSQMYNININKYSDELNMQTFSCYLYYKRVSNNEYVDTSLMKDAMKFDNLLFDELKKIKNSKVKFVLKHNVKFNEDEQILKNCLKFDFIKV